MQLSFQRMNKWLPSGVAGIGIAVLYLYLLNQHSLIRGASLFVIFPYLWAVFSLLAYVLLFRITIPRLESYSTKWRSLWLAGCLLAGLWLAHNIPVRYPPPLVEPFGFPGVYKLIFLLSAGFGIGLLLFAGSVVLATWGVSRKAQPPEGRFRWAAFALPMLIAWVVFLLAFWPGMMSNDSLDQWRQVLSGQYNDHHPAFHTLTIWLVTRVYLSPAVVALAQIVALGLLSGAILAGFESLGVPSNVLWAASLVFALSPVNGTMVNTLWKDIPYSTALLGFTFLLFRLVYSGGTWIAERKNWLILGITAGLVSLFRHNGLPVVLATFLLLLFVYHRHWRPLAFALLAGAVLYYGVRGPLYRLVQVDTSASVIEQVTSLYSVGMAADPGSEAETLLLSIRPFSGDWECDIGRTLPLASTGETQSEQESLAQEFINLVKRSPNLLMYYYRCGRSIVWIIWDPFGPVYNPSHVELLIDPNPYGLIPASKIPALRSAISGFVVKTGKDTDINWLVWRPALYLYLFLFVISVQVLRQKNIRWYLTAAPVLVQSVAMTLLGVAPNFRLYYATYLITLLFWPLLFLPVQANEPQSAPAEATAQG
jgi:hypothetical protein